MCSAESRDCWKRGRYDQTSRPCTRSRMWLRPGRTSPGTCQGFMGFRPAGRERQDAGHTARSCFVWPRYLQRVTYLLAYGWGELRVIRPLDLGLDQKAIEAV